MSGENSLQKSVSSSAAAGRQSRRRRGRSTIPSRGLRSRPPRLRAALLAASPRPRRLWEGRPRPRAAASGGWPGRAPAIAWRWDSGLAGAPLVVASRPRPHSPRPPARLRNGGSRALDGPEPRSAPRAPGPQLRPLGPSLTVSVAPAKGRDATGTAGSPPPFPKRAPAPHLTVTPLWGGGRRLPWRLFFGFLIVLALPWRQSRLSGPPRPPAHWLLGWFPGSDGAASAPLFAPSPRSSRFLFHPRDHERCRRHAYYGAGRRSPESARRVRLREPRRRRPRRPDSAFPRPRPLPQSSFPGARVARGASGAWRPSSPHRSRGAHRPLGLRALSRGPAAPGSS